MNKLKPHLGLILCNLVWAMDYPIYSIAFANGLRPIVTITLALCAAGFFSLLPLLWEGREKVAREDILKLIMGAILVGILRKIFLMYGMQRTSPIDGSIISTTVPLLAMIFSIIIGIDKFSKLRIAGLLLGMGGAVAIVALGAHSAHQHATLLGNMLIFFGAISSAVYVVWFKGIVAKYRVTTILRWVYCISALIILPFGIDEVIHTDFANMPTKIWWCLAFIVILPTYLPNLLLNYSLRFLQPTVSSIYQYLQPVVAIAVSVAMKLDSLHWDTIVAALGIFAGVGMVIATYSKHDAEPPTAAG